jgi:hypothetical protein
MKNPFLGLFCFVGFFGASVTAVLLFGVKGCVDFFANRAFLIHLNPSRYTTNAKITYNLSPQTEAASILRYLKTLNRLVYFSILSRFLFDSLIFATFSLSL